MRVMGTSINLAETISAFERSSLFSFPSLSTTFFKSRLDLFTVLIIDEMTIDTGTRIQAINISNATSLGVHQAVRADQLRRCSVKEGLF